MSKDCYFVYLVQLIEAIFQYNVSHDVAQFIAAQSCLETGFGTSNIYRENHNLFGMKVPSKRITTCIGNNRGHASYYNEIASLFDYWLWLVYFNFDSGHLSDVSKFSKKLASTPFNPNGLYCEKVMSIYNTYSMSNP